MLSWLGGSPIPWRAYIGGKRWLAEEEARRREEAQLDRLRIMSNEAEREWRARGSSHAEAVKNETRLQVEIDPEFRDRCFNKVQQAKTDYLKDAKGCPKCGTPPANLSWFRYESLPVTLTTQEERDGWITFCEKCNEEVEFFKRNWFHTRPGHEPMAQLEEAFPEDPEVCPVHIRTLLRGKAPVAYGLIGTRDTDAHRWLFPYARSVVLGGCTLGEARDETVRYCPKCRQAEQEWQTRQQATEEPLEAE